MQHPGRGPEIDLSRVHVYPATQAWIRIRELYGKESIARWLMLACAGPARLLRLVRRRWRYAPRGLLD